MKYLFKQEYGAIISSYNQIISLTEGVPSEVTFPIEMILEIHKKTPGYISKLAHTHPPGMDYLSDRDLKTLKTLAFTLYPYPISMSVIFPSEKHDTFIEKVFSAILEPKEFWIARGKGVRKFDVNLVEELEIDCVGELLIKNSYINISYH